MTETSRKINLVHDVLEADDLSALRLRGVDWFSWLSGGKSNVLALSSETGICEFLVTRNQTWLLCNAIERPFVIDELMDKNFELFVAPWEERDAISKMIASLKTPRPIACDKP